LRNTGTNGITNVNNIITKSCVEAITTQLLSATSVMSERNGGIGFHVFIAAVHQMMLSFLVSVPYSG
jgi:hypothetical protein